MKFIFILSLSLTCLNSFGMSPRQMAELSDCNNVIKRLFEDDFEVNGSLTISSKDLLKISEHINENGKHYLADVEFATFVKDSQANLTIKLPGKNKEENVEIYGKPFYDSNNHKVTSVRIKTEGLSGNVLSRIPVSYVFEYGMESYIQRNSRVGQIILLPEKSKGKRVGTVFRPYQILNFNSENKGSEYQLANLMGGGQSNKSVEEVFHSNFYVPDSDRKLAEDFFNSGARGEVVYVEKDNSATSALERGLYIHIKELGEYSDMKKLGLITGRAIYDELKYMMGKYEQVFITHKRAELDTKFVRKLGRKHGHRLRGKEKKNINLMNYFDGRYKLFRDTGAFIVTRDTKVNSLRFIKAKSELLYEQKSRVDMYDNLKGIVYDLLDEYEQDSELRFDIDSEAVIKDFVIQYRAFQSGLHSIQKSVKRRKTLEVINQDGSVHKVDSISYKVQQRKILISAFKETYWKNFKDYLMTYERKTFTHEELENFLLNIEDLLMLNYKKEKIIDFQEDFLREIPFLKEYMGID